MKDPQRLIQNGSSRAKALLASLDDDVPPDPVGAQARLLRALDGAPNSTGELRVQPHGGAMRKWLALASVGGLLVVSAAAYELAQRDGEASVVEVPAAQHEATPTRTPAEHPEPPGPRADVPPAPLQSVDVHALAAAPPADRVEPSAVRTTRSAPSRDPGEATPPSSTRTTTARETSDELALLEAAQAATSRGRPEEALSLVTRHRRDFPRGRFAVEMSVVEIEALARTGRVEEATVRGRRFLEAHPGSPYTRRVEAGVRSQNQKEQTR